MAEKTPPSLSHKKDLILHSYDSFLIAQTRLFVQSTSDEKSDSAEIDRRRELLLLDDLTNFAIAARRIIELMGLKSFANRRTIPLVYLDQSEEPYRVMKAKTTIGFLTLMSRLIHSSYIEHIDSKLDFVLFLAPPAQDVRERIVWNRIARKDKQHEPIEQLLFVSSEESDPVLISIKDMIQASVEVADRVISMCADQKIFLELDFRGAD